MFTDEEKDDALTRQKPSPRFNKENTNSEEKEKPFNPGGRRMEGNNYERRSYRQGQDNRGGYNRPSYGDRGNYNRPRQYDNNYGSDRQGSYNGGSYDNRGGYEGRDRQGSYNRGGYNNRGYNNNYRTPQNNENLGNNEGASSFDAPSKRRRTRVGETRTPIDSSMPGGNYNNNYNRNNYDRGGYNNYREGGYNNNRGGYNNRQDNGSYNRGYYQEGGYDNRGGYRQEGGYDNNRGGYNNNRYNNNRRPQQGGGYNNRNNYDNRGQNNRGGYNPNAKYSKRKQIKYKEMLADPNEPIRLNKFLANAGVCSRREADEYIAAGVVSVNDVIVTELGTKITRQDKVLFHDRLVKIESKVYVLLNKPKNCVTTSNDPQERLTVMDLVKNACEERIYPVGRLDRNTTGVLLFTNDGDLASKLTHPSFKKKKVYHVWLDKNVAIEDMQKIADGIELEDGEIHADAISYANEEDKSQVGIEIHSGRNRIVRRIFESLGYHVTKLDRVYFAGLTKKNLPRGKWRYLNEREVNALRMGAFE